MSQSVKVSIIVPNYNHARFLKQRLDSIFNQTFQDFEVILLDDCSTDNSVELLKEYASHPKVSHFIVNRQNSGSPFSQWEKGIDLADGKYIWIAESDDFSNIDFLYYLVKEFEDKPELGLCYCRSYRTNKIGENLKIHRWGEEIDPDTWDSNKYFIKEAYVVNYLRFRNTIPNVSAVLFKREALKANYEIKKLKLCGDWLLYVNLAFNYPILYVSKPLNYFRRYSESTTSNNVSLKKAKLRIDEYFKIINYANNITKQKFHQDIKNYKWICFNWINNQKLKKNAKMGYYFPNIPPQLMFSFYKILVYRLLREKILL